MKLYLLLFLNIFFLNDAFAQHSKKAGNLFIIGGGSRSPALIQEMVNTADLKENDYIVVLPMASGEPEASYQAIHSQIKSSTGNKITSFNFTPETVNEKKWVDSLRQARLIFITGGSQERFMQVVLNTPVYDAIHTAYSKGATIAGTSAGAAVMSKFMITGNQLAGDTTYRETFDKLWDNNIEFSAGLGLLESAIIDQHFIRRSRYNRLISSLSAHPKLACIGIDEGTAIVVNHKNVKVVGESQIVHLSKPKSLRTDEKGLIKVKDMKISIYSHNDVFKLP